MIFSRRRIGVAFVVCWVGATAGWGDSQPHEQAGAVDADLIVVGAGISGLCAAIEAGEAGLNVLVVDMWSVFGGHAVMSSGKISIVGTPIQEAEEIEDSVELARKDFHEHGEVADADWVRLYCARSREWVFDWLGERGVGWSGLERHAPEGNSVRRLHAVEGRGMGLVAPLFRHGAALDGVRFGWNEKVTRLLHENGRITGVEVENQRDQTRRTLRGRHVVLATGGFQNNLELVRRNWPELGKSARVLKGAGINALGSGLELASEHGARIQHLDRQWNYRWGLPHPQDPKGERGLGVWMYGGISVNAEGQRFMDGTSGTKHAVPAVVRQPGGSYFQVFDRDAREILFISGSGWDDEGRIQREIFENPRMAPYVMQADTLAGLAKKMGVDAGVLEATVARWNGFVASGEDEDFKRRIIPRAAKYQRISHPPFYAFHYFPMTRKSFGGVAVDTSCRVLTEGGEPIPGLLAVGEVTGFAGVNGKAGLEGTMLGPSVLMGRIAGQTVVQDLAEPGKPSVVPAKAAPELPEFAASDPGELKNLRAFLRAITATPRPGYLHFEKAHAEVLARGLDCRTCHRGPEPATTLASERLDHIGLSHSCSHCHSAKE